MVNVGFSCGLHPSPGLTSPVGLTSPLGPTSLKRKTCDMSHIVTSDSIFGDLPKDPQLVMLLDAA